jgi:hypothetical protein
VYAVTLPGCSMLVQRLNLTPEILHPNPDTHHKLTAAVRPAAHVRRGSDSGLTAAREGGICTPEEGGRGAQDVST